jgi:hypothetical protein
MTFWLTCVPLSGAPFQVGLGISSAEFPISDGSRCVTPIKSWLRYVLPSNTHICATCIMPQFVSGRVYEMRAQMNAGKIGESEKVPMLQRLLQHRYSSCDLMPDHDIISECMGHMYVLRLLIKYLLTDFNACLLSGIVNSILRIAGSDTTSTSLSYFFWELSRRADILKKLQSELDEAMPDAGVIPDISILQELPYLGAFIKEGVCLSLTRSCDMYFKLCHTRPSCIFCSS